jgi:DNA-binding MarR family transcriptional regulator
MTTTETKRDLILALQRLQRREDFRQLNLVKPVGKGQGGHRGGGMRAMLLFLAQQDEPALNMEIAEAFDIRPSSVTSQVAQAEEHGFVTRVDDPNDRRRKRIQLTDKGLEFIGGRREKQEAIIDGFFANLTDDEVEDLLTLVTKLNDTPDIERKRGPRDMDHFAAMVKARNERFGDPRGGGRSGRPDGRGMDMDPRRHRHGHGPVRGRGPGRGGFGGPEFWDAKDRRPKW